MAVTGEPLLTMLIAQDLSTPLHVFQPADGDCRDYIYENDSEQSFWNTHVHVTDSTSHFSSHFYYC